MGERISFEKRYVRPNGHDVWIRSNLAKIDGHGPTARFLKIVEDISERKAAQSELEAQRHSLEVLNQTGAAIAAQLDTETVVQTVMPGTRLFIMADSIREWSCSQSHSATQN